MFAGNIPQLNVATETQKYEKQKTGMSEDKKMAPLYIARYICRIIKR
jgi:hypothetical protein